MALSTAVIEGGLHRSRWRTWPPGAVAAVVVVSAVITLLFWSVLPPNAQENESTDYTAFYEPVARNILRSNSLQLPDGRPAADRPPGYPALLAGLFGLAQRLHVAETTVLSAFALFLTAVSSVLLFAIASSVWGTLPALFASLLWMTYPLALWLTKQPNSEIPFMVAFYLVFLLFWHLLHISKPSMVGWLAVGVLSGAAMLIRPIAGCLGLVLAGLLLLLRRRAPIRNRVILALILLIGNAITILPWEVWLYRRTGDLVFLGVNGPPSVRDGLTFALDSKGYRQGIRVPDDVRLFMEDIYAQRLDLVSEAQIFAAITREARIRPLAVTKLLAIKVARSWYGTDSQRQERQTALVQALYLVFILWCTGKAWRAGGAARDLTIAVWLIVLYFWMMTVFTLSIVRYMVPAMGLLLILTAAGFRGEHRKSDSQRGVAAAATGKG